MKRTVTVLAGLTLASGAAYAQQTGSQEYDPERDITTQTEQDRGTGMDQPRQDSPVESDWGTEPTEEQDWERSTETQTPTERDYGTGTQTGQDRYGTGTEDRMGASGQGLTGMTAEELQGKSVTTVDGEEIGEIDQVGYSSTHQEQVATVEVGGFLGVGQKRIAIPLSHLERSDSDPEAVKTSMTRDQIESQEEFDETGFEASGERTQY